MITKNKIFEMLSKTDVKEERIKIIFESLTYKEAKNNPNMLCCIYNLTGNLECIAQENCRTCRLNFIKKHRKDFKRVKEGNTLW